MAFGSKGVQDDLGRLVLTKLLKRIITVIVWRRVVSLERLWCWVTGLGGRLG